MAPVREVWEEGPSLHTSILRHWLVVLATGVLLGGVAYATATAQDAEYEAVAELVFSEVQVRSLDPDEPRAGNPTRWMNNRIGQIDSGPVLERAAELAPASIGSQEFRDSIDVWGDAEETDSVWIHARAGDADDAAAMANAVGQAYQEVQAERERARVQAAIDELDAAIARMEERIDELDAGQAPAGAEEDASPAAVQRSVAMAQIVELTTRRERLEASNPDADVASFEPATAPWEPVAPRPRLMGALGALIGLGLASAWAYWWEGRGIARSAADVRSHVALPLLAELPRLQHRLRPLPLKPRRQAKRLPPAYEFLALAIDQTLPDQSSGSVLFAPVRSRNGEATVASDAALALCEEGRRVYLVDANMRDRQLSRLWHMARSPGLTNLTDPRISFQQVRILGSVKGQEGAWGVVAAGTRRSDPPRIQTAVVQRLLDEVEQEPSAVLTTRVVLHGPPVLEVADAGVLSRLVDGVVLEVFARTKVEDVQRAVDTIELAGGRVLGFAFIRGRSQGRPGYVPPADRRPSRPRTAPVS